ncbi:HD-GYP domain-containing protein [Calidifontibacter indicus]|uniref:HD-GYP domain-containing protein n=1 Tax=Calidifontibacter indicus TaxID=419650 RepID=UPI003D7079F8
MSPARSRYVDLVVTILAIVAGVAALAVLLHDPAEAWAAAGWRWGVMVLALALAGPLHLRLPGGFDASPVAPALGLAMVLSPLIGLDDYVMRSALVVVGVIVGTGIGLALSALTGQGRPVAAVISSRIVGAAAAAALFRNVPWADGEAPARQVEAWADTPWRMAVAMTICGAVAVLIEMGVLVLRTAPIGRIDSQAELVARELGPIWLAVLGIAVAIALGFGPLDLWSVPIMASPLLLMRTALRRQAAIAQVRHDTIEALSRLTDGTGFTTEGHGRRVRDLTRLVGTELMLTERELRDLEMAAMLHDVGQLGLCHPLPGGATSEAARADQVAIAADGAAVIREFGGLERVAEIVELQSTPFRNVREFGEDVPIECRILKACNAYDDLTQGREEMRPSALERISLGMGYEYDPDVVDLLSHLTRPAR